MRRLFCALISVSLAATWATLSVAAEKKAPGMEKAEAPVEVKGWQKGKGWG
ncbi:hypothetical protein HYY27_08500, partial [bacterium]|nr:hypothetical protein [bacterium]